MKRRSVLAAVFASFVVAGCGGDDGAAPDDLASVVAATTVADSPSTAAVEVVSGPPDGVVSYGDLSQEHTSGSVDYEQVPPVGGPHDGDWESCRFYDAPIRTEKGVHSMEHGAVWITYQPGLPSDQLSLLQLLTAGRTHVLVSPFEGLTSPVVASAWGQQLVLDSATDPRLLQFVEFFEEGPQTPEPGASC